MADEDGDPGDPDYIAARPPAKATDPKTFFQIGAHEGKWSEYDERGVPTKSIKKKKPTKKEKDGLEQEYLEASKSYQKWLKDVQEWEQAKVDAEAKLQKTDRLRWAFRQIGEKNAPIDPDEMEPLFKLMGWKPIPSKEMKVVKKGLIDQAGDDEGKVGLEELRKFTVEAMPVIVMEERLGIDAYFETVQVEELYSPRTWRRKLEENPVATSKKATRSSVKAKTSSTGGKSPRGGDVAASPRSKRSDSKKVTASKVDRGDKKKKTLLGGKKAAD